MRSAHFLIPLLLALGGCDLVGQKLGIEDPAKKAERLEAEGKAVGGACRHSGRAIEDCYSIYSWLPKAAVFTGWRDMDAYMRENQIETVAPQLPPPQPPTPLKKKRKTAGDSEEGKESNGASDTAADKGNDKAPEKAPEAPPAKASAH